MTSIVISDLTTYDSKLSASADGFLNELQKTETTQIFGGWRGGGWYEKDHGKSWKKDDCYYEKEEKCDYKEKSDHSYYYKEKRNYKYSGGWKKDC